MEFGAQIEVVLAANLKPTHLDWQYLRIDHRADISDLILRLAKEYGLAFQVTGRSFIEKMQSRGLPANDHDLLDIYMLDPVGKPAHYAQMLHGLPTGRNEWVVHPGLDNAELLALEPDGNHFRQTDFYFWMSQQAKNIIK